MDEKTKVQHELCDKKLLERTFYVLALPKGKCFYKLIRQVLE